MKTSEAINELVTALSLAQSIMKPATKSKTNPHFKNKYADLDDIWNACREPLGKNGLSIIQTPSFSDGRVIITTRLCHKSGQWIEDQLSLKPMKDDAQAAGSCITYGRRQMMSIIGITSDEDDDGNIGSQKTISLYRGDESQKKILMNILIAKEVPQEQMKAIADKLMNTPMDQLSKNIEAML